MPLSDLIKHPVVARLLPAKSKRRAAAVRAVRRVAPSVLPKPLPPEEAARRREEKKLRAMWANHDPDVLEIYLVSGYQDPRLNAQSVLARHTLIRALFGDRFDDVMRAELAHAAELNAAIRTRGLELGVPLIATMDREKQAGIQRVMEVVADQLPVFGQRWRDELAARDAPPLRVVEFACGSANDYRTMAEYGIARFLDYTGIDLNEKNIANAKKRFPDVDFRVDSILSLDLPDRSVDLVIGFDILEHLSLAAMHTALTTAMRIARQGLYFALFRMDEVPEHQEHPRAGYHYNLLSVAQLRRLMEEHYADVQLIHVPKLLADEYGFPYGNDYNRRAYSLITHDPR